MTSKELMTLGGLFVFAVVTLGLIWRFFVPGAPGVLGAEAIHSVGEDEARKSIIVLSEAKLTAAKLEVTTAEVRRLPKSTTVTGRVQYDDARHVEVRATTDCTVVKVLVRPGDRVQAGQVLAELHSPEVGTARANLLQRGDELRLAEQQLNWERETSENIQLLAAAIESRRPLKDVRAEFELKNWDKAVWPCAALTPAGIWRRRP